MRNASASKAQGKLPELGDYPAYAAAKEKLTQISGRLAETVMRQKEQFILRNRASDIAKRWLSGSVCVLPSMTSTVFDEIASKVIEAGEIPSPLMARLRSQTPEVKFVDSNDAPIVEEIQRTEAAVLIFKRAAEIQESEVRRQKSVAIREICNRIRSARENISNALAGALLQLLATLREENEFVDRLRLQDEALPAQLSPPPFPAQVLADPLLLEWISLATRGQTVDIEPLLKGTWPREIATDLAV